MTPDKAGYLFLIALFRTFLTGLILMAEGHYRTLLKNEEHENRYRRLFLMTTGLKNEIYFMRKNSEEIESVMANAYKLYEKLNEMDVPEDMKHMSLCYRPRCSRDQKGLYPHHPGHRGRNFRRI